MHRNIVYIDDLSNYDSNFIYNVTIKVAVSIKSIEHNNGEINYFYMDIRDKSGDISAVAYDDASTRWHNYIKKNHLYTITGFCIKDSVNRYTSILHEKQIVFTDETEVQDCGRVSPVQWPPTYHIGRRTFYNITAVCVDVGETKRYSSNKLIRKIKLLDEYCDEITLFVWNEETKIFDYVNCESYPVLFVKDARVCWSYDEEDDERCMKTTKYVQWLDSKDPNARRVREAVQNAQYSEDESSDDSSYYDDSSS